MAKIGKYSGNERLDPKEMEEPDLDNEFTRKMWFEDIKDDEDFLEDIKEHVKDAKFSFYEHFNAISTGNAKTYYDQLEWAE